MQTPTRLATFAALGLAFAVTTPVDAAPEAPPALPIKEVTVFKDGHAFVLHEGEAPTDEHGDVVLDDLPRPVLGTFWPYASQPGATLKSVTAGKRPVEEEQTALTIPELLLANVGSAATFTENGRRWAGTIVGMPSRKPADGPEQRGSLILVRTAEGVRAFDVNRITEVTFAGDFHSERDITVERDRLTLDLDWEGEARPTAKVGMVYLERGLRWIPSYRIDLDGSGTARVRLQATLINELADLDDATLHLVVGVPTFQFAETVDPMALQESLARLSSYFQSGDRSQYAASNAIMTQAVARMSEHRGAGSRGAGNAPADAATEGSQNEDLFVFRIPGISLAEGARMVVEVTRFEIPYEDLFTLDLPVSPPTEVRRHFAGHQLSELTRLMRKPKVMHKIRLDNRTATPLTTAPALILREGRLLAQGMVRYAAPGSTTDVPVTAAVDIQVSRSEEEVRRDPDAATWDSNAYTRITIDGRIKLVNRRGTKVKVEVTRYVLGEIDDADEDAAVNRLHLAHDADEALTWTEPSWWRWWNWPYWWHHFNGASRVKWNREMADGDEIELSYRWHYFWR